MVGEVEHALYHARKSASVKADDRDATIFFQSVATMCLNFRRKYMKKHFPNCTDEMWCLGKAIETARQRVYEADEGDTEDLNDIDAIWNMVWREITGKDLSGCSSCKDDRILVGGVLPNGDVDILYPVDKDDKNDENDSGVNFIDKWTEYHSKESNFTAEMLYIGANETIRQGPLEVRVIKNFHFEDEPTYSIYWKDVDGKTRWLEYSTFTALLNEWDPIWKKGLFDDPGSDFIDPVDKIEH